MAKRKLKTLEEFHANYLRMYERQPQWGPKLITGEITKDDLSRMAMEKAEDAFREQQERQGQLAKASDNVRLSNAEIDEYRVARRAAYLEGFEWDEALDGAALDALVGLEVQLHILEHDLQMPKLSTGEKQKLMGVLLDFTTKAADLRAKLGVDLKSRKTAEANKSPIARFDEQVGRFARYMQDRIAKFPEAADHVESEKDLREAARYFLGLDFRFVDSIMRNTKRLNGLEPTVEEYD